jgi:hypothetical protein
MGLVKKGQDGKYYFCTDVSKTDTQYYDNKTRYTCCFLILEYDTTKSTEMKSRFIGRFVINPSDIKASNLVLDPSDKSKPLYVNYSIDVNASNPEKPYLSLPEVTYRDIVVRFSYTLEGLKKIKRVTLISIASASASASSRLSSREMGMVGLSGISPFIGGTRRRKYRASTSTKKSKKTKINKKQNYKNKRTSQKKHKKSRK